MKFGTGTTSNKMKRIFIGKRNKVKQQDKELQKGTTTTCSKRSVILSCTGTSTRKNNLTGTDISRQSTNTSSGGTSSSSTSTSTYYIELPPTLERLQWDLSIMEHEIADEIAYETALEEKQQEQTSTSSSSSSSTTSNQQQHEVEHSASDILADLNNETETTSIEEESSSLIESVTKSEATISIVPSIDAATNIEIIQQDYNKKHRTGINTGTKFVWFPGLVSLSVLESMDKKEISLEKAGSWGKFFIPSNQRAVRESCYRHLQLYRKRCNLTGINTSTGNGNGNLTSTRNLTSNLNNLTNSVILKQQQSSFPTIELTSLKVTSSLVKGNLDKVDKIVRQLIQAGEYDAAIVAAEELLVHLTTDKDTSTNYNLPVIEDPLAASNVARQLVILCLAMGRNRDATKYSAMAVEILPDVENPTREHATTAAMVLVEYGLVSFGTNKIGQALKTWREATHMAIGLNGYQDKTVAVLLSYIGVLHLVSGNVNNSLRSLEESYDLQRYLLSEGGKYGLVESAIYRLATTMGNLALACERSDQNLRAIALLDESIGLYESILVDSKDLQDIARNALHRLVEDRYGKKHPSKTLPTITEDDNGISKSTVDARSFRTEEYLLEMSLSESSEADDAHSTGSNRSMSLFGNFDGIPDRRIGKLLTREQADNHDFLLLGSLCPESTSEQRVRDTVLSWFGKRVEDPRFLPNNNNEEEEEEEKFCFRRDEESLKDDIPRMIPLNNKKKVSISGCDPNNKQSIPVDVDEENVLDADLRLREIHKQAMIHLDNHEYDAAVALFKSALRNHMKKYGTIHHLIGRSHHNIGMIYLFAKKYDAALKSFEEAVNVRLQALGPDHPDVQCSKIKIALIHMAQGELSLAHDGFWDIKKRSLNVLGPGHPQLAKINTILVSLHMNSMTLSLHGIVLKWPVTICSIYLM